METTWWTQPEHLDDEQRRVVALDLDPDHLILGPPGSGKTNLLVLRATYLHTAGMKNIAVITFGRVLKEFLAAGSSNYQFPSNRIQTFKHWATDLIKMSGVRLVLSTDFGESQLQITAALADLASRGDSANYYDCILIDEAQDYTTDELDIIGSFTRRLFVVGDDRQAIYDRDGAIDFLRGRIASVHELKHHYRNGLSICRVADGIVGLLDSPRGLEATSQYDEAKFPSTVETRGGIDIDEQFATAVPDIETQLRAYPDGIIGLLCPRRQELRRVWELVQQSSLAGQAQLQQYDEGYLAFDGQRRVVVTTTHGAKGLEFRALHLLGMEHIKSFQGRQRRLAYTAVTRAKTSLHLYHDRPLPAYLDRGLEAVVGGVLEPRDLSELFR